jgi:hypothetical protein
MIQRRNSDLDTEGAFNARHQSLPEKARPDRLAYRQLWHQRGRSPKGYGGRQSGRRLSNFLQGYRQDLESY